SLRDPRTTPVDALAGFPGARPPLRRPAGRMEILTKGMRDLLDNIEPSSMEGTATRVLLAALLLLLCVFVDRVRGYLARADTPHERPADRRGTAAVLTTLLVTGFALRLPDLGGPALNW